MKEEKIKLTKEKADMLLIFSDIVKKYGEEKLKVIKYVKEKEELNTLIKNKPQLANYINTAEFKKMLNQQIKQVKSNNNTNKK